MIFEAKFPGFSITIDTPFSVADVNERPELKEKTEHGSMLSPRGFTVTFKRVKMPEDGKEHWIYDTDRDKRINDRMRSDDKFKKHVEAVMLENIEMGEQNFKIWEPPKEKLYDVDEVESMKKRLAELESWVAADSGKDPKKGAI